MKLTTTITIIAFLISLGMMVYGYSANDAQTIGLSALAIFIIIAWSVAAYVFRARGGNA